MRVCQVKEANGLLELVEKPMPEPMAGEVRIKIHACGICHSDAYTKEGKIPGISYPRVPGHEIAGVIDQLGTGVSNWKVGDRVGVGWFGGHCGTCSSCRHGDFITCTAMKTPGISYDGGYGQFMVCPASALAHIPEGLSFVEAAPMMCAGITTFNALRHSGARGGDLVAVLGIGGLGHLAIQFATKMGFKCVAIARGADKGPLALQLGAFSYIDSQKQNPSQELMKLGGARVILCTVSSAPAAESVMGGLGYGGNLIMFSASQEPVRFNPLSLIRKKQTLSGWASGTSMDSEETLAFCDLCHVRSMNEVVSLEEAPEAYEKMMRGEARFRMVIDMNK